MTLDEWREFYELIPPNGEIDSYVLERHHNWEETLGYLLGLSAGPETISRTQQQHHDETARVITLDMLPRRVEGVPPHVIGEAETYRLAHRLPRTTRETLPGLQPPDPNRAGPAITYGDVQRWGLDGTMARMVPRPGDVHPIEPWVTVEQNGEARMARQRQEMSDGTYMYRFVTFDQLEAENRYQIRYQPARRFTLEDFENTMAGVTVTTTGSPDTMWRVETPELGFTGFTGTQASAIASQHQNLNEEGRAMRISTRYQGVLTEETVRRIRNWFLNQFKGVYQAWPGPKVAVYVDDQPAIVMPGHWQKSDYIIYAGTTNTAYEAASNGVSPKNKMVIMAGMMSALDLSEDRELIQGFSVGLAKILSGTFKDVAGALIKSDRPVIKMAYGPEGTFSQMKKNDGTLGWFTFAGEEVELSEGADVVELEF